MKDNDTIGGQPRAATDGADCPGCTDGWRDPSFSAVKIKIRPMGGQDYEVRRNGVIAGTAHFERFRTSDGISIRAWIDRPNHATMVLNTAYYEDFAKRVRQVFR